jgi:hypothetical protein
LVSVPGPRVALNLKWNFNWSEECEQQTRTMPPVVLEEPRP